VTDGGIREPYDLVLNPAEHPEVYDRLYVQVTPTGSNVGDGMTFAIQNRGLTARGGVGGALGYQSIYTERRGEVRPVQ